MSTTTAELREFLVSYPDAALQEMLIPDIAGYLRGKRILPNEFEPVFRSGFNMPAATLLLDTMGAAIDGIVGDADGDPDVYAKVVPGTLAPVPWSSRPCGQALFSFFNADGSPYFADSRHVLERAAQPLRDSGLTIVMAIELEFYLLDAANETPAPRLPRIFGTNQRQEGNQTYQPDDLWQVEAFLQELNDCCKLQNLPIGTAISEYAAGQYEINLHHVSDPLRACDHAVLLKRAIKAVALRHGFVACFMAKPFAESAGSGLHVHVSLVDEDGRNFFSRDDDKLAVPPYSDEFRGAVGGLVQTMAACMPIFSPNVNSYRRLRPDFYAPINASWGSNHRNVALRVPLASPANTRIEHRTSGADANPYLVAAAVLMGIDHGMRNSCDPGEHIDAGTKFEPEVNLPIRLDAALDHFAASDVVPEYMGAEFHKTYEIARRVEGQRFNNEVTDRDYQWYLRSV